MHAGTEYPQASYDLRQINPVAVGCVAHIGGYRVVFCGWYKSEKLEAAKRSRGWNSKRLDLDVYIQKL